MTNGFNRRAMTKPRPLYLAVCCCMSTNLCPDASSRSSLAATFVSWRHVKSRWYLAQSLPSCCHFSAAFSPCTFHVAREIVKLLLSRSARVGAKKGRHYKGCQSRLACHLLHDIVSYYSAFCVFLLTPHLYLTWPVTICHPPRIYLVAPVCVNHHWWRLP